jgi:hypothetical protein
MEAATAEISESLFANEDNADKSKETAGEKSSGNDAASPQENKEGAVESQAPGEPAAPSDEKKEEENSAGVQATGAPKTWNKEELAAWATIPKEIQDKLSPILARREEDFLRGIQGYKGAADLGIAYSKVVEPYAPILAAENIDPVQLFQSFAANHYLLLRGAPEQKIQLAAQLLDNYKIPLGPLLDYIAESGTTVHKAEDPAVVALRKEIEDLKQGNTARQTAERDAVQKQLRTEIDKFAETHEHFDELAEDIQKLFESKQASTLQEAYDKALFLNPQTREKELARLTDEKLAALKTEDEEKKKKVAKLTGDQLAVGPKSRNGTVPKGTMDDTLAETLAAIESRG